MNNYKLFFNIFQYYNKKGIMMNKNTLKTAIYFVVISLIVSGFIYPQDEPKPQFYGVYMVIDGKLIELRDSEKSRFEDRGNPRTHIYGIPQVSDREWLSSNDMYFIVYGDKAQRRYTLSKLKYVSSMERPATPAEEMSSNYKVKTVVQKVDMNMHDFVIDLRVAPIQGLDNARKYVLANKINEGAYAFHDGVLTSGGFSMGLDPNADIWDFVYSVQFRVDKPLEELDFEKGEYTFPGGFGVWILDKSLGVVEVPKASALTGMFHYYYDEDYKLYRLPGFKSVDTQGLKDKLFKGIKKANSATMANYFIVYNENAVGTGSGTIEIAGKSIAPQKMFLSKLKSIEIDTRSKRAIKKNKPPKLGTLWIEEISIPLVNTAVSWYSPLLYKITFDRKLEPGKYAFHNGRINGRDLTFGVGSPRVFYFEVQ